MSLIRKAIVDAASGLQLAAASFACVEAELADKVVRRAMDLFVDDHPRVWWLALKRPFVKFSYPRGDGHNHLEKHLPGVDKCWFIAETDADKLPVFEVRIDCLKAILDRCPFFEYYLVGIDFGWILIENDHNEIIIARDSSADSEIL